MYAAAFAPASADGKGLRLSGPKYHLNWKTKGIAAGSYLIVVKLQDGTTHSLRLELTEGGGN